MTKLLILAALATLSFGQPASAQSAAAPAPVTAIVVHKDLDLATSAGTKTLERRIWRAVVNVCGTASDFDLEGKNNVSECRRNTQNLALAQADAVIAGAARDQMFQVSSIRK